MTTPASTAPRRAPAAPTPAPSSAPFRPVLDTTDATLRYAQCWEDASVLLDGLDIQPGDVCLSIASAGDNALALLTRHPERVVAIDVSGAQLACLALRVAAYRTLEYGELLELVGSRPSERRAALYRACRPTLDAASRAFWDARPSAIERGIGDAGRFERYLRVARRVLRAVGPSPRTIDRLLDASDDATRRALYAEEWNTWRWRLLMRLFCSESLLSRFARDAAFFAHVADDVGTSLRTRLVHALTTQDASDNSYLQWILTGEHRSARPVALQETHFETIRANLDRLEWRQVSLEDFLRAQPTASFDRFNLSNVFEYVSEAHYHATLSDVARVARPGARIAYWNLFVDRTRPASLASTLVPLDDDARRLHRRDRNFFYKRFVLEEWRSG